MSHIGWSDWFLAAAIVLSIAAIAFSIHTVVDRWLSDRADKRPPTDD